jgi:hypothetical protein
MRNSTSASRFFLPAILMLSAVVRLSTLGYSAFRADTMEFYRHAASGRTPWMLLKEQPWENQIPVTEAYVVAFIRLLHLPVNAWTVRFPIALLGILAVWFIFRMAEKAFGRRTGLLAAFLVAINPFATAVSMEAYYYSGLICFAAFFYWRSQCLLEHIRDKPDAGGTAVWMPWLLAGILMCATQMTAWSVFGVIWLLVCVAVSRAWKRSGNPKMFYYFSASSLLVVGSVAPWLIKPIRTYLIGNAQPLGLGAAPWSNFFRILGETIPVFTFGKSWWGMAIAGGVLIVGVVAAYRHGKGEKDASTFARIAACAVAGNVLLCLVMGKGHAKYTYFAALFPLVIVGLAYLLDRMAEALSARWPRVAGYGLPAMALLCAIYWGVPLHAVMTLEGKPTAYKAIAKYINENTAPGTLVLVDRWLEPWNELSLYPLEDGREWTFTVPNEPGETGRQMGWQGAIQRFFEENPTAVYLPLLDSYRSPDMGVWQVGPWEWPDQHFANRHQLKHRSAIRLAAWGLSQREDFYDKIQKGRLVVNLYFNTVDDIASTCTKSGAKTFREYGSGWGYLKPWRPLPGWSEQLLQTVWVQAGLFDERGTSVNSLEELNRLPQQELMQYLNRGRWADYRVASDKSTLRLYNLTESELAMTLEVSGMALSGRINARLGSATALFPPTLLATRKVPVLLKPGENLFPLTVPSGQFLLVHQVRLSNPETH